MNRHRWRRATPLLVILGALMWPAPVLADAEIENATPADGAVLAVAPPEIVITYTQELDASRSSLTLHDAGGAQVAGGGVDAADARVMRLDPPDLAAGTYEIRSAAFSAEDAHLVRQTLSFTIHEPTPSPTQQLTTTPEATATPEATPSPSASPIPSPSPSDPTSGSAADILLPVIAAIVIAAAFAAWLLRNRSRRAA